MYGPPSSTLVKESSEMEIPSATRMVRVKIPDGKIDLPPFSTLSFFPLSEEWGKRAVSSLPEDGLPPLPLS